MTNGQSNTHNSYARHAKLTLRLSIPVIIGQMGHVLMGQIDNIMIGDLGYTYLSAASLANSIFILLFVFGIGISFAISPLVAEAKASGKHEACAAYLKQGVWIGWITGLVLVLAISLSIYALPYLDQPPQDVELATTYMILLGISALPNVLFLIYKHFADGLSATRPAMVVTLLALLVNTFANWLLIYGNWGFPRLELIGAGYATLISRIFMYGAMYFYVRKARLTRQYRFQGSFWHWDSSVIKRLLNIGLPSGFQYFFEVGAFSGAAIMVGKLGMADRAAHQIAIGTATVTYMVVMGISSGATIRVGTAFGLGNREEVRRAGLSGIGLGAGFMFLAALMLVIFRYPIARIYVDDIGVIATAANLLMIAALFQIFDGIQAVALGALRGIQDVNIPTLITLFAYWGVALPTGYLMAFVWGVGLNGVWYSLVIGLLLAAIFLTTRFLMLVRRL